MKKLFLAIGIALSLGAMNQSYAADAGKGSVTREDAAAVQKGVQELAQMFGVEKPKPAQQAQVASTPAPTKTVADVMDKAVDKISDVVGAMAQAIKNIAPDVWRIMIKQQYAKAIGGILPWLGLALIVWVVSRSFKQWRLRVIGERNAVTGDENLEKFDKAHGDEYSWACGLYYGSLIITGLAFFFAILDLRTSIQLLINPEFYAIQDLLRMILNKGM